MNCIVIALLVAAVCAGYKADDGTVAKWGSKADFETFDFAHARWGRGGVGFDPSVPGEETGGLPRGVIESQEVSVPQGFDEAIVSWNATTPAGSSLVTYLRARIDGEWTSWYNMGLWSTRGCPTPRTSLKGQSDDHGTVSTDTLVLKKRADALKVRIQIESCDGKRFPVLRFLAVNVIDTRRPAGDIPPVKSAWGKELDVPELCQLSVPGGNVWCSPTSTAMVLGYWSKMLKRPDLTVGITEAARGIHDDAWRGTGNWCFNTAYAGEFKGIRAYVSRFSGVAQIEQWTAAGVPVIVSVDYNKLNRRKTEVGMGHLMVVRGFTASGDPIFNDPWAHLEKGEKVRKVFRRADLEHAWLGANGSRGTVYLIYPETPLTR